MTRHRWLLPWGVGSLAAGAASLLVPLYVVQLGGTPLDLGLLGAVAAFVGAPGAILWGRVADRTTNPRALVAGALVGVGVLLAAIPATTSIPLVIAANAGLWLAFAAGGPVVTLLVVADVPEREWSREIAALNTYQGYGWAAGLLLGIAWTAVVGQVLDPAATQASLFVACGVVAVVAAGALLRTMPAPSRHAIDDVDPRRVARVLARGRRGLRSATFVFNPNRLYWSTRGLHPRRFVDRFTRTLAGYYLVVLCMFTGFAAFFAPLPLYLRDVGFSGDGVFGLYLVAGVASAVCYAGAGTLSERLDVRYVQASALGVRALAIPLVAVGGVALAASTVGLAAAVALFAVVGATWAVIAVTAGTVVARLAPDLVRGEALGVFAALSTLAGGIGSIAGGALAGAAGFTVAFAAAGALVLTGAAGVLALRRISTRTAGATATPGASD